jgi:hypothetical protein
VGGVVAKLHAFNSALDGGECSFSLPISFNPCEISDCTH